MRNRPDLGIVSPLLIFVSGGPTSLQSMMESRPENRILWSAVERVISPLVLLVVNSHAWVVPLVKLKYPRGGVLRTVVNDDKLVSKALFENALNSVAQESLAIKHAHQHRNEW